MPRQSLRRWTDADGAVCTELAGHSQLLLAGLRELLNLLQRGAIRTDLPRTLPAVGGQDDPSHRYGVPTHSGLRVRPADLLVVTTITGSLLSQPRTSILSLDRLAS